MGSGGLVWRGWYPIAERFDDEGYSGATVARPALERLLDRIEAGEVQRVIVDRVDRLTRKLSDWARLVAVFDRLGVGLTVVSGVLDIKGGSMARFQLNMLATMAELELDMIGERLADARAARKAQRRRSAGSLPLSPCSSERRERLQTIQTAGDLMWPFYRRQALIEEVASLRWDGDHGKLLLEHKK